MGRRRHRRDGTSWRPIGVPTRECEAPRATPPAAPASPPLPHPAGRRCATHRAPPPGTPRRAALARCRARPATGHRPAVPVTRRAATNRRARDRQVRERRAGDRRVQLPQACRTPWHNRPRAATIRRSGVRGSAHQRPAGSTLGRLLTPGSAGRPPPISPGGRPVVRFGVAVAPDPPIRARCTHRRGPGASRRPSVDRPDEGRVIPPRGWPQVRANTWARASSRMRSAAIERAGGCTSDSVAPRRSSSAKCSIS